MATNTYPFSVFYFTKSVFDKVGENDPTAIELIFKAILINTCFREIVGTSITFTTKNIIEKVKDEVYFSKFKGFMALGENIAHAEDDSEIRGDDNFRIVQHAINKDGDVIGLIKITAENYECKQNIKKIIDEENYPIGVVSCKEALEELRVIETRLKQTFGK